MWLCESVFITVILNWILIKKNDVKTHPIGCFRRNERPSPDLGHADWTGRGERPRRRGRRRRAASDDPGAGHRRPASPRRLRQRCQVRHRLFDTDLSELSLRNAHEPCARLLCFVISAAHHLFRVLSPSILA